jgi:hypothetical protein
LKVEADTFKEKCRRSQLHTKSRRRELEYAVEIKWYTNVEEKILNNKFLYRSLSEEIAHTIML